jgi:hypothetical protein
MESRILLDNSKTAGAQSLFRLEFFCKTGATYCTAWNMQYIRFLKSLSKNSSFKKARCFLQDVLCSNTRLLYNYFRLLKTDSASVLSHDDANTYTCTPLNEPPTLLYLQLPSADKHTVKIVGISRTNPIWCRIRVPLPT